MQDNGLGALMQMSGIRNQQVLDVIHRLPYGQIWMNDFGKVRFEHKDYFHSVDVSTSGFQTQSWFTGITNSTKNITNWDGNQGIPADSAFWMTGFSFTPELGLTVADADVAGATQIEIGTTTLTEALQQSVMEMFQAGYVEGRLDGQTIFDGRGMVSFPSGNGFTLSGSSWGTTSAQEKNATLLQNGAIGPMFRHRFPIPILILPNKALEVVTKYNAALTPTAAYVITARAHGVLIRSGKSIT